MRKQFQDMTEQELANLTPEQYDALNEECESRSIFEKSNAYVGKERIVLFYDDTDEETSMKAGIPNSIMIEDDGWIHGIIPNPKRTDYVFANVDKIPLNNIVQIRFIKTINDEAIYEEITENLDECIKNRLNKYAHLME